MERRRGDGIMNIEERIDKHLVNEQEAKLPTFKYLVNDHILKYNSIQNTYDKAIDSLQDKLVNDCIKAIKPYIKTIAQEESRYDRINKQLWDDLDKIADIEIMDVQGIYDEVTDWLERQLMEAGATYDL